MSAQDRLYHRTFLSLALSRTIYNEDERYQNYPNGVPNRQAKMQASPTYKYHVEQGPRYPQRAPGRPIDSEFQALLNRSDGSLEPLVIIPKRSQRFESEATPWEKGNSILCGGRAAVPIIDDSYKVVAHQLELHAYQLLYPTGIYYETVEEYIMRGCPVVLWNYQLYDPSMEQLVSAACPPGWSGFQSHYAGGIRALAYPNGEVYWAEGHKFTRNNGWAESTISPLDFWTPGQRQGAAVIRALTNRVAALAKSGWQYFRGPTKELAEATLSRLAGSALAAGSSSAKSIASVATIEHAGRRTLIMGKDIGTFRKYISMPHAQHGFYDVMIHGDSHGFYVFSGFGPGGKPIWTEVGVRDLAEVIRPRLAPGEKIRLLSCETGVTGGPGQQLSNELGREVWAPTEKILARPHSTGQTAQSFVPVNQGKFNGFTPQRGRVVVGSGVVETGNETRGVIVTK